MLRFSDFDTRGYRTVDVRTGYGEWVTTYEQTVQDVMDIALLDELTEVSWPTARRAVDLGCGTGRTGTWLHDHGVTSIDGVDLTPEMLEVARSRGMYERLIEADVTSTGLRAETYDLLVACLIDEHLPDVRPLYQEARRLATPDACWVLVTFHPHFIMASGMPTHFTSETGESIAIDTHVHLLSDHIMAGLRSGWTLVEAREGVVDERWLAVKPQWERFRTHPVSAALVWRRQAEPLMDGVM
jgi:SAM-dependent methyltransferase